MAEPPRELSFYQALFIGLIFSVELYGIALAQTFMYYSTFKDDKLWMKIFVALLLIMVTGNLVCEVAPLQSMLIEHYGEYEALRYGSWGVFMGPALTAIIASMFQLFYAWRIKILVNKNGIVGIVACLSLVALGAGIGISAWMWIVKEFQRFTQFKPAAVVFAVTSALVDIIIAVVLVTYLSRHRTGVPNTDTVINKIIRVTIPTGLLPSLFSLIKMSMYLSHPRAGYYLVLGVPLSNLYAVCLLASLLSRSDRRHTSSQSSHTPASQTIAVKESRTDPTAKSWDRESLESIQFYLRPPQAVRRPSANPTAAAQHDPEHNSLNPSEESTEDVGDILSSRLQRVVPGISPV